VIVTLSMATSAGAALNTYLDSVTDRTGGSSQTSSSDATTAPPDAPDPFTRRVVEGVAFEPGASLLMLTPEQQRVAYRNIERLAPTNVVAHGAKVWQLPTAQLDLRAVNYEHGGRVRTLDEFMTETRVAGLLVIRDGRIVLERYEQGHGPQHPWTSFSVAKSVLSLLFGAALRDGSLRSIDDPVSRYLPALRGSAYDAVSIRQLLQMSSGVAWNDDDADPSSDLLQMSRLGMRGGVEAVLGYMKRLPRRAPAGSAFNYNTGETNIAGALLRAATGRSLARYLSEAIWKPAGMESDAYWLLLRRNDAEYAGCCLSATLRDYGRLGLLALRDGVAADGTHLLPAGWMAASTTPAPTRHDYGYLWWLEGEGRYAASGMFGQYIYVDPGQQTVVAIQSLWPASWNDELLTHQRDFVQALVRAVDARSAH